jgi:hypothetical protein
VDFNSKFEGVTEAFVHSVAPQKTIRLFNHLMIVFSLIYLASAIVLISYFETVGLIVANCISTDLLENFIVQTN